jgi:hypothetical protein
MLFLVYTCLLSVPLDRCGTLHLCPIDVKKISYFGAVWIFRLGILVFSFFYSCADRTLSVEEKGHRCKLEENKQKSSTAQFGKEIS